MGVASKYTGRSIQRWGKCDHAGFAEARQSRSEAKQDVGRREGKKGIMDHGRRWEIRGRRR
jgi:hypothetical protein